MPLNLQHQTPEQFTSRFRERYRTSTGAETSRLAAWLLDRIAAGDMTDLQARNAFGMTLGQWTALKARLTTQRTNYMAVQAGMGE